MSHTPGFTLEEDSKLCAECQGLSIDEKASGGVMELSVEGTPRLRFETKYSGMPVFLMPQRRTDTSPDFPTLASLAALGCGFCGFFRAALLRQNIQALECQREVIFDFAYAWGPCSGPQAEVLEGLHGLGARIRAGNEYFGVLHFAIYSSTGTFCYLDALFAVFFPCFRRTNTVPARSDDPTANWLGLNIRPRPETLCPENISFLKHALESFATDCHPPAMPSFIPTRLLDIGTDPAANPRLVITANSMGAQESIRYAAVSYCWGSQADAYTQTKTEPSNLRERLRGIPTCDMSAVLQDSITVCRALSVRYLWIDALCIIQDPTDPSDWEKESERVGQIYQHAHFTICVLAAPNCHQRFLARSQHTFDFNFRSSLHPGAKGKYSVSLSGLYSSWPGLYTGDPASLDLQDAPWNDRGWVFQERDLSARKLLFGRHMVHFQCGRKQSSENGRTSYQRGRPDWTKLDQDKVYEWFRIVVQQYSTRDLTLESDRLPALAGLAKHIYEFTGARYLAGLWMEDLPLGLLWHRTKTRKGLLDSPSLFQTSGGSAAPSWSWASRPGYIGYLIIVNDVHDFHSEYVGIDGWTTLKGAQLNRFGEVKSGTIQIRGCKVLPVPADFVLSPRPERDWCFGLRKGSSTGAPTVADCYLDWDDISPTLPGGLGMLLLTSVCRYENEDDSEENDSKDHDVGDDDSKEADTENGRNDSGKNDERGDENSAKKEKEDVIMKEDGGDANPGRLSEFEIGELATGSGNGNFQRRHTDTKPNRHAWGLLIHPTGKIGQYSRVGVFKSRAGKSGGTRLFRDLKEECVWIV